MNLGLSHIGATPARAAYAATGLRADVASSKAAETQNVSAAKAVRPARSAAEARENIREQVLAERGYDLLKLYRMGSQQRIQAEAAVAAETAKRVRQEQTRATATLIDLRV